MSLRYLEHPVGHQNSILVSNSSQALIFYAFFFKIFFLHTSIRYPDKLSVTEFPLISPQGAKRWLIIFFALGHVSKF